MVAKADVLNKLFAAGVNNETFTIPTKYAYALVQVRSKGVAKFGYEGSDPSTIFNGNYDSPAANYNNLIVPGGYSFTSAQVKIASTAGNADTMLTALCYLPDETVTEGPTESSNVNDKFMYKFSIDLANYSRSSNAYILANDDGSEIFTYSSGFEANRSNYGMIIFYSFKNGVLSKTFEKPYSRGISSTHFYPPLANEDFTRIFCPNESTGGYSVFEKRSGAWVEIHVGRVYTNEYNKVYGFSKDLKTFWTVTFYNRNPSELLIQELDYASSSYKQIFSLNIYQNNDINLNSFKISADGNYFTTGIKNYKKANGTFIETTESVPINSSYYKYDYYQENNIIYKVDKTTNSLVYKQSFPKDFYFSPDSSVAVFIKTDQIKTDSYSNKKYSLMIYKRHEDGFLRHSHDVLFEIDGKIINVTILFKNIFVTNKNIYITYVISNNTVDPPFLSKVFSLETT